ncbi:MAG: hypothetical protein ACFB4I_19695 [Cyanophyceae cyanobacterium]
MSADENVQETDQQGEQKAGSENNSEQGALSISKQSGDKQPLKLQLQEHTKLPGQRPVESSHLRVVETFSSVGGNRPITASTMEVSGMLTVSGKRPIAASHLQVSETYVVMGNRPVASNEIDPTGLMGYLD